MPRSSPPSQSTSFGAAQWRIVTPWVCAQRCSTIEAGIAFGPAAVDDRHLFGAEQARLHRRVDRRHAAADDEHAPADRHRGRVGLAQFGDELDRVAQARDLRFGDAERVDAGQAEAEEHRVELAEQRRRA